jgi:cystathionine gamma-lyase
MSANALAVADFLAAREDVEGVVYPGLKTHPGHEIARGQMKYFGPVLGFTLKSRAAADRFLAAAELVTEATSFGGIATTAERRGRWGHDDVAEGFVRMSVGCEDVEDLMEDLGQALDGVQGLGQG